MAVKRWRPRWRQIVVGLLVVVVVGGLITWRQTTQPGEQTRHPGLPIGDELAYTRTGHIWTLQSDGTSRQLTHNGSSNWNPVWSPNGQWLLYYLQSCPPGGGSCGPFRAPDRWLVRADGSGAHELGSLNISLEAEHVAGTGVSWSPDGNKLAYINSEGGLLVGDPVGAGQQQLLGPELGIKSVSWSPDGGSIAFGRHLNGLWLINATGGEPKQIASYEKIEQVLVDRGLEDSPGVRAGTGVLDSVGMIRWSPKGDQIAFAILGYALTSEYPDAEPLFTVGRDGGGLTLWGFASGGFDWSPDSQLAFASDANLKPMTKSAFLASPSMIAVAQPGRSSEVRLLTKPSDHAYLYPRWSPTGDRIAFQANTSIATPEPGDPRRPDERIWIVKADGSGLQQVGGDPGVIEKSPIWSGDGTALLESQQRRDVTASPELWLMRPGTGDGTLLVPMLGSGYAWHQAAGGDFDVSLY